MQRLPDQLALDAAQLYPEIRGAALAALAGDERAESVLFDLIEEVYVNPFEVGKSYLICTVTLYYIGRVVESNLGWLKLEEASWVHWTGRLSVLLGEKTFKTQKFRDRKPRTEFCGEVIVPCSSIVSAYPWDSKLPGESVE